MMLRPREDDDRRGRESERKSAPEPSQLSWTRDMFDNHVAIARFADRASELRFESTIRLDHAPADFGAASIANFARTHPFAPAVEAGPHVARFMAPRRRHPKLDRWAATFLREGGPADTRELLPDLTQTIRRTFRHLARQPK